MAEKDAPQMANVTDTSQTEDDLTLKLWAGDESAKGELLIACGGRIEVAIRRHFPGMSAEDAEDVVAESISRFWRWRDRFDPKRSRLATMLYKFAYEVACELTTGRLRSQKAQLNQRDVDADFFLRLEAPASENDPPDDIGNKPSPVQTALAECYGSLPALQKDILLRFAAARSGGIDAATVGKDLGDKHKDGVPIPAGTIRTNRSRAWASLDGCMKLKGFDLSALGYTNE